MRAGAPTSTTRHSCRQGAAASTGRGACRCDFSALLAARAQSVRRAGGQAAARREGQGRHAPALPGGRQGPGSPRDGCSARGCAEQGGLRPTGVILLAA